jgi:hypothetical protein
MVSSGLLRSVALVLTRATRRNNPEDTIFLRVTEEFARPSFVPLNPDFTMSSF